MTKNITLMMALLLTFTLGTKGATTANEEIKYIEWSWNYDEGKLVQIDKTVTDYTLLTGHPGEWEMLGSNDDQDDHYYVVKGNVEYQTLNVFGRAHLIICDGATLTCTGGIKVNRNNNHADAERNLYPQWEEDGEVSRTNPSNSELHWSKYSR